MAALAALALAVPAAAAAARGTTGCPKAWAAGWIALANRVQAPVYCPRWMPSPLDAKIGGEWQDIYSIGKDRSYLVSFLYHGDLGTGDVHVNFRGYPGRTAIPKCLEVIPEAAKTIRTKIPCFADPVGTMRSHGIEATVYQVNQDADQWHILLAWHYRHSLYTVSEHVIAPYRFSTQVRHNLQRLLDSLVLVRPTAAR